MTPREALEEQVDGLRKAGMQVPPVSEYPAIAAMFGLDVQIVREVIEGPAGALPSPPIPDPVAAHPVVVEDPLDRRSDITRYTYETPEWMERQRRNDMANDYQDYYGDGSMAVRGMAATGAEGQGAFGSPYDFGDIPLISGAGEVGAALLNQLGLLPDAGSEGGVGDVWGNQSPIPGVSMGDFAKALALVSGGFAGAAILPKVVGGGAALWGLSKALGGEGGQPVGPQVPQVPQVGGPTVVKTWGNGRGGSGPTTGLLLSDGRIAALRANGTVKVYRPQKHIVVSRNPRLGTLARAASRLDKLTRALVRAPRQAGDAAARVKAAKRRR